MILDRDRTHTQRQTGLMDSTNFSLGYVIISTYYYFNFMSIRKSTLHPVQTPTLSWDA